MPDHQTPLIATIAAGLVLAYLAGRVAHRLRVSPLVGYLLAGVLIGPFTPGFVADQELANELAEIGVILLMFAVGLHFSVGDLMKVRAIAVPGAVAQMAAATVLGLLLSLAMGWGLGAGLVFGLALSVASTVVLVRALQERRILESDRGRIAVGWLIVEDLAMVLALVLLPSLAPALKGDGGSDPVALAATIGITLLKVSAFVAVMLLAGRKVIPWIMHDAAHTGSRELFRLAVYAVALGVAFGAAKLFGVSFALGAFFAGMVLGESRLSQRAAEEALPLRDAFAVLFFVSVGMLFNPGVVLSEPLAVLATVLIIVVGKGLVAFSLVRAFGHPSLTGWTVAAALAQIGEFSFILIGLGMALDLLPEVARDTVLAGAIISILLNPVLFGYAERKRARRVARMAPAAPAEAAIPQVPEPAPAPDPEPQPAGLTPTALSDHDVVIGHGRVGSLISATLRAQGRPVLVVEERAEALEAAQALGCETLDGQAADPEVLAAAGIPVARRIFVTLPEPFEAGQVVQQARALAPDTPILARAHSEDAVLHLAGLGATLTVMGEREIAHRMLEATATA